MMAELFFSGFRLVLAAMLFAPGLAWAQEPSPDPVTEMFSAYDPESTIELDHGFWSGFLSRTVVHAGYSKGRLGRGLKRGWIGTRMRYGNDLPSRYENNRVVLDAFDDTHLAAIRQYREGLEALPGRVPLELLNRGEQLAFWLNLYNAHVLEHVAAHYPAETTEKLRSPPGAPETGVWRERTLEVAGVPLSLREIETRILFPIWHNPLVLYGLWQGAIGGPRLPTRAYTGSGVWDMLEDNAREFVNSNRGMRPDGGVLEVSLLYGWGAPLFAGEASLRRHIEGLAVLPFAAGLETAERVRTALYDWHLADLSGGTHFQGQWNNMAALVAGLGNGPESSQLIELALRTDTSRDRLPAQTIDLLQNMDRFNDRERRPVTGVEECPREGDCAPAETPPDQR